MQTQRIAVSTTLVALLLMAGAVLTLSASTHPPRMTGRTATPGLSLESPINGIWVGRWKANGDPGEGKSLMCETVQVGEHAWKATFNAVCDKDYAFTMEVPGRREGDDVVFEATVDLGEAFGGVYHWTGSVIGDEFAGVYSHARYNGTFQMAKSPDGVIEPGVYCKVPAATTPPDDSHPRADSSPNVRSR